MLKPDTAAIYTDFNGLAKLKQGAREQSPEAIKEVAKQFESVFLTMVLKSMRQAKLADGVMDSKQSEFYQDMYDQQMAIHLAGKPGIGLADLIAQQLSPKQKRDDDDKQQAGDLLNRALSTGQVVRQANSGNDNMPYRLKAKQPLAEHGLSGLQENLAPVQPPRKTSNASLQTIPAQTNDMDISANKELFISQLLPYAQHAADTLGVDANVLLAQAALETGWGKSVIKNAKGENSFNLFNIKADRSWQGKQARVSTLEFDGGVARKEMAGFRSYESYKESFDDYVDFIKSNPRYSEALKKADNAAHYVRELQKAGYATDPRYAEKIMTIYNSRIAGQVQGNAV